MGGWMGGWEGIVLSLKLVLLNCPQKGRDGFMYVFVGMTHETLKAHFVRTYLYSLKISLN